jgi:hypothetical protein
MDSLIMEYRIRHLLKKELDNYYQWWQDVYHLCGVQAITGREHSIPDIDSFKPENMITTLESDIHICTYILETDKQILATASLSFDSFSRNHVFISNLQLYPEIQDKKKVAHKLILHIVNDAILISNRVIEWTTDMGDTDIIDTLAKLGFIAMPDKVIRMKNYLPLLFRLPQTIDFFQKYNWWDILKIGNSSRESGLTDKSYLLQKDTDELTVSIDYKNDKVRSVSEKFGNDKFSSGPSVDFQALSGKNIKIALIDSGIDTSRHDLPEIAGGIGIDFAPSSKIIYANEFLDTSGHGTFCAQIISEIAPNVKIYPVKIFQGRSLSADIGVLVEAIRWAIEKKVQVINCSLGTTGSRNIFPLLKVCNLAQSKGIHIIAANSNKNVMSFPASFHNVIGVSAANIADKLKYGFLGNSSNEFIAKGDWFNNGKQAAMAKHSTSYAAAAMTGIVALSLQKFPNLSLWQLKKILIANASPDVNKIFEYQYIARKKRIKKNRAKYSETRNTNRSSGGKVLDSVYIAFPGKEIIKKSKYKIVTKPVLGMFVTETTAGNKVPCMIIEKLLINKGYYIYNVSSDSFYPINDGQKSIHTSELQTLLHYNIVHSCEEFHPDLVLAYLHLPLVHPNNYIYNDSEHLTTAFLLGTSPDAFLIIVSSKDSIDYINRYIDFLNKKSNKGRAIALVFDGLSQYEHLNLLKKNFKMPIINIQNELGKNLLLDTVIEYFTCSSL